MSLLAMIAAWQTSSGPIAPPPDPRPAPLDELITAIRPTSRIVFDALVSKDGGDFNTISEALDEATRAQAAKVKSDGLTSPTPNHSIRVIIGEGEYREPVRVPAWSQIYGAGMDSTVILPPGDGTAHRGVMEAGGRLYVESLTLRRDTSNADRTLPVYPVHTNNNGTSIYANVFFDNVLEPNGFAFGSDGAPEGATYLYRCKLTGGINGHGWAGMNAEQRMSVIATDATMTVGWSTMNDTSPADVWVVRGASGGVKVYGASARLHLDPEHTNSGSVTTPGPVDSDTRWPIPFGGLSPWDRDLYGFGPSDAPVPENTPGY